MVGRAGKTSFQEQPQSVLKIIDALPKPIRQAGFAANRDQVEWRMGGILSPVLIDLGGVLPTISKVTLRLATLLDVESSHAVNGLPCPERNNFGEFLVMMCDQRQGLLGMAGGAYALQRLRSGFGRGAGILPALWASKRIGDANGLRAWSCAVGLAATGSD